MIRRCTLIFLRGLLLIPLGCFAVSPYVPIATDPVLEPWRWQHVEYLDGAGVLCMDEVPDGTLWFGAVGSLIRDDGRDVTRIQFDNDLLSRITSSRPEPWASTLLVLDKDDLLVVIGRSLVRWHNGQWSVLIRELEPINFDVRLFQSEDNTIWLQTRRTLWRISDDLHGGQAVVQLPENCMLSACAGREGAIWFVQSFQDQDDELIRIPLEGGKTLPQTEWKSFPIVGSFGLRKTILLAGKKGHIWFADSRGDHGVLYFDTTKEQWFSAKSVSHSNSHYSLLESRDGTLWAGGAGEIFSLGQNGASIYLPYQLGLPVVPLYLFETSGGRIWVLTQFGRIYNVDTGSTQWQTYPQVHFQCESADGKTQWFLTKDNHAVCHDRDSGRWLQYEVSDGMISLPRVLVRSSHGLVWAAGSHGGVAALAVFDGKQWKRFRHPEFAESIAPRAVFEAMDGTMWFGTTQLAQPVMNGGALQYRVSAGGEVGLLTYHTPPFFPIRMISVFAQQDPDALWLGHVEIDRYHLNDQRMEQIRALPWRITDDMVVDAAGALWVAKGGFGIYRKESEGWARYSTEDGLASSLVSDLLPLRDGTLLAASGSGISRFDGRSWTTHAFPPTISMVRNGGNMHQAKDGSVWLNFGERDWQLRTRAPTASLGEHTKFCSVRYVADTAPPQTRITYCLEKVAQPGNSRMAWAGRDLWDNTPPELIEYSWRLDKEEWSPYSLETDLMFPKLSHGLHEFEIRARDRDYNVDPTPAIAQFNVVPPVWLQAWFIALLLFFGGLVVLLVWIIIRIREHHLVERQLERENHLVEMGQMKTAFFTNISHELNTPLTLIREPLERVQGSDISERNKQRIAMAIRNAGRVSTLVSQLLDFRKLEQGGIRVEAVEGDVVACVRESVDRLQPLAQLHRVSCRLEGIAECHGWFDPDKLGKIVNNLVGNAIKYTGPAGDVRIVLEMVKDGGIRRFSMGVEDTGVGIEQDHLQYIFNRFYRIPEKSIVDGSGIGLNLAKELVELLGGTIRVESPIHQDADRPGTRFVVCLPIDREGFPTIGEAHEE